MDEQQGSNLDQWLTHQTTKPDGQRNTPRGELASAEGKKPQLFLAAPGLPTISYRVAQKVWDLEFVEMEDFLPPNKTIQALETQQAQSLRNGVIGALQQLQQQQTRRVTDVPTWTRCFSLYLVVMAHKKAELVPAYMHAVLRLQ